MTPPANASSSITRNVGIDCLRGFAILLVLVHHLALPFRLPLGPSLLKDWLPKRLLNAISFNGYEAVFIFFVISGFLIATRIIERDGALQRVDLRRFYRARALRILPLLLLTLGVLSVLALFGVKGFAPDGGKQSLAGLLGSSLSFTFNWYEGRTGWAPAGWDVLWSLSIEEVFYLGFPLLCLWLPRRLLIGLLLVWALALNPLRNLVPMADEVWREKAYLPGMSAIAWGVLAALLAQRWRPSRRDARALALFGAFCIVMVLGWGELVHRHLFKSGMVGLVLGAALMLLAFHAHPPAPRAGWRWLARMGSLSYELYLSHMFIVLAATSLYRALLGKEQAWTFTVYLPVLLLCFGLALVLEKFTARFDRRKTCAADAGSENWQFNNNRSFSLRMDHSSTGSLQLSKHRIEALVDGIFAVAMTLLVIDLRLPEHLHLTSDAQLREALAELLPNLYSWLVSFIVLGIFWVGNHRVYSHVRHVDGGLVWRTILMLGGASLLPFASAVNGHFFSQLAQAVYSGVMILIGYGSLLVARYIHRNPQLCAHPMDDATYVAICARLGGLGVIALLAVALAGLFPGSANCAFVLGFGLRRLGNAVARRYAAPPAEQPS